MAAIGVIPARMASSRFPGKPLTPIAGKPMLWHCHRGAAAAPSLDEVVIATCDAEIADWAGSEGIRAIMTADTHERATDRVAEAAESLDAEFLVLIQGDEPMVTAEMVESSIRPVIDGTAGCTNLSAPIEDVADFENPATIKIVADRDGRALYMSRSPIPSISLAGFDGVRAQKQVCIFGFTREYLMAYPQLEPTPLEVAESIDMNRYLEHGMAVHLVPTDQHTHAVDVPADVAVVEQMLAAR